MGSNRGSGIDRDRDGIFSLRFGRCYTADRCVNDPSCEFYTEHCDDADEFLRPLFEADVAPSNSAKDSGGEKDATAPPNFTAGKTSNLPSGS
jgi:hypothetical protein